MDHVSRVAEHSVAGAWKDDTWETARDLDKREENYGNLDSYALHRRLSEVDPETAKRLHPRDRRKIIRWFLNNVAVTNVKRVKTPRGRYKRWKI